MDHSMRTGQPTGGPLVELTSRLEALRDRRDIFAEPLTVALSDRAALGAVLRYVMPCLLCGGRPHVNGVFTAKDQKRMGAPPGKIRLVRYSLCRPCYRKPGTPRRVEERLLAEADARAGVN